MNAAMYVSVAIGYLGGTVGGAIGSGVSSSMGGGNTGVVIGMALGQFVVVALIIAVSIDRAAVTTPDLSLIDNPTLRDAIAHAAQSGSSIVAYGAREKADGNVDPR